MTIVVAVDGERVPSPTVEVGADLARHFDEELVVVHVMPQDVADELTRGEDSPALHLAPEVAYRDAFDHVDATDAGHPEREEGAREARERATGVARYVVSESLEEPADEWASVTVRGRVGDIVEEILAEANDREARYLLVGGRKRTAVGKAIFGSVTQSLLLDSDRPVVTVPDEGRREAADGPVVAAVDRSDRAARVVEEASSLAVATGRDLHVVHVLTNSEFIDMERTNVDETGEGIPVDQIRSTAATVAEEATEGITDDFVAVGIVGQPSERILEYASDHDASYVVTAGRRRSPVGKVLFGSVTQPIILNADCAVLSIMSEE